MFSHIIFTRSLRELSFDVPGHRFILKNDQNTHFTESGGTVISPRTSHSGGPGSILARGRPPREGFQWFTFPLQVNTGVVPLQIGHAIYLPPTHPSPSSRNSSITLLFASQSLTTSPLHSDYK